MAQPSVGNGEVGEVAVKSFLRILDLVTEQRPLGMVWRLEAKAAVSYLVGSVHFFPYQFRRALGVLLRAADTLMVEGPLEIQDLREVARRGLSGGGGPPSLSRHLDDRTLRGLERLLEPLGRGAAQGASIGWPTMWGPNHAIRHVLDGMRPWMAFFTLWVTYLERRGWIYNMDRDALETARRLGRNVLHLESLEEQVQALERIPLERILGFLRAFERWGDYTSRYVRLYLQGDLDTLLELSHEFPSRCGPVIDRRDEVLYRRMVETLSRGGAVALVGAPHVRAIKRWLQEDGFRVEQVRVG